MAEIVNKKDTMTIAGLVQGAYDGFKQTGDFTALEAIGARLEKLLQRQSIVSVSYASDGRDKGYTGLTRFISFSVNIVEITLRFANTGLTLNGDHIEVVIPAGAFVRWTNFAYTLEFTWTSVNGNEKFMLVPVEVVAPIVFIDPQ